MGSCWKRLKRGLVESVKRGVLLKVSKGVSLKVSTRGHIGDFFKRQLQFLLDGVDWTGRLVRPIAAT